MLGKRFNKQLKTLLINLLLFPVFMGVAVPEGDGGEGVGASGEGEGSGAGTGTGGEGSGSGDGAGEGDGGSGDEPTYEQLTAQAKEISDKAEALRVSKLTDEEKADEEAARKSSEAPEEYADFTMPEGMPVDEELLNDFKPLAKELNLPQEQAQKLIDLYAGKVAPLMVQRQQDAWNQQLETWVTECKADKEIGGDKYETAVSDAKRVINTIGTQELKDVFNQYGLGNNPELVRVFSRMSKYLKEDDMETGGSTRQQGSIASRLYPNLPA